MSNITFVLFSYNEEKRIEYAIKNFIKYGEVVILDGGSTDNTKKIAEDLGARFVTRTGSQKIFVETEENFQLALDNSKTDWIYWGYVDNIAPKKLVLKLVELSNQSKYKRVIAPMHTYLWGNTKHCAQKSYIPLMFHKDYMDFKNNRIHSMGRFTGETKDIITLPCRDEFTIRHFSLYDTNKFVTGYLRYANDEAEGKFEDGERFSIFKLLASILLYAWIYRSSLKTPKLGMIIILNFALSRVMTYGKLYELETGINIENEEDNYRVEKEKLIQSII